MSSIIDLLRTFIAFRSVGDDRAAKSACLDWIAATFLSASGLEIIRGDVKGAPYIFLRHPAPKLLWFGHTDVVPAMEEQFAVRVDGDNAYGRGVKDMKGADLCFLIAYREACVAGAVPPVSVLLTSDEETGGDTPAVLFDRGELGTFPVAFTPDTGDVDGIVTELKGALWLRITAHGRSGHGALPWKSDNAVPKLLHGIEVLLKAFPAPKDEQWGITVTPTQLTGSDAPNRIPAEAGCMLDVRFPSSVCATPDEAFALIARHLPSDCRAEAVKKLPPASCDSSLPMVQLFKRIGEEVTGAPVEFFREHGSSDVRYFTERGIPAFLYGPRGGDLHGAKEWVSVKSLEQHVEINRRLLRYLSQ